MTAYVRTRRPELSAREVDVLAMVASGMTNAAIGRELGVSEEAVKRRLRDIREVLGALDRANAVNEGWRQGYLPARRVPSESA